jgi:hypothetical protein
MATLKDFCGRGTLGFGLNNAGREIRHISGSFGSADTLPSATRISRNASRYVPHPNLSALKRITKVSISRLISAYLIPLISGLISAQQIPNRTLHKFELGTELQPSAVKSKFLSLICNHSSVESPVNSY